MPRDWTMDTFRFIWFYSAIFGFILINSVFFQPNTEYLVGRGVNHMKKGHIKNRNILKL